jgi:type IV secretory pathway TraG/TraD family ATPase VirD4
VIGPRGGGIAAAPGGVAGDRTVVRRPLLNDPSDYLLAGLLTVIALVTGGVWAVGQTAALLTGHGWPNMPVTEGLAVATRLPRHLSDPAAAWPTTVRASLPGPVGFVAAAILDLLAVLSAVVVVARGLGRRRRRRGFASPAQLRAVFSHHAARAHAPRLRPTLTARRQDHGRAWWRPLPSVRIGSGRPGKVAVCEVAVDAGRADPHAHGTPTPLAVGIENSVLVLAAPRTGKTSQVVIPWVTNWPGPALVTSVRSDVALATLELRRQRGPVAVMDLTGTTWPDPLTWSPTTGCERFDAARRRADLLVTVGKTSGHGIGADSTNAAFFGTSATNLLAAWLHAAALTGHTMTDVLAWALNDHDDTPIRLLDGAPRAATGVAGMLDSLYRSPAETRANLFATVLTGIAPLLSETAAATFSPPPTTSPAAPGSFAPRKFLDTGGTVYLIVPDTHAAELAPLIASFVDDLLREATTRAATSPSGRLDPPLGLFLDEVANVAPLPQLPQVMSYAAGSGIFVTAVLQDLAQARARWGHDGADMLWSAATCKVILGGLTGGEPDQIAALAGSYRETLTTTTVHTHTGTTLMTGLNDRPVLTPDTVRTLDPGLRQALLLHATTPPVITRMTRHYEGPHATAHTRAEQALRARLHAAQPATAEPVRP